MPDPPGLLERSPRCHFHGGYDSGQLPLHLAVPGHCHLSSVEQAALADVQPGDPGE